MIFGKRDVRMVTRLRWDHLRLTFENALMQRDMNRLLQYGALVALAKVQHDDFQPILDDARSALSRPAYEDLLRFVERMG